MSKKSLLTRRDLLVGLAGLPLILPAALDPKRVVVKFAADGPKDLLMKGLEHLNPAGSGSTFFSRVLKPSDRVGIKLNCLAGKRLSPRPELVMNLVELITKAGVPAENVTIFERSERELTRAGFTLKKSGKGPRVLGVGKDWEPEVSESGEVGSCYAKILTRGITKLINVGVLKDHDLAGVSVGLKNFYGVIHNPNKYHMNNCSPYVAHVANHPSIKKKLILTVIDAHRAQYHGGPAFNPRYTWKENAVYLSSDPVAIDAVGWDRIEAERKKKGMKTLKEEKREPAYIRVAADLGLGTDDMSRIRVVTL